MSLVEQIEFWSKNSVFGKKSPFFPKNNTFVQKEQYKSDAKLFLRHSLAKWFIIVLLFTTFQNISFSFPKTMRYPLQLFYIHVPHLHEKIKTRESSLFFSFASEEIQEHVQKDIWTFKNTQQLQEKQTSQGRRLNSCHKRTTNYF